MNKIFPLETPLFDGIAPKDAQTLLTCLHAGEKRYRRNEVILHAGSVIGEMGLVLSGSVNTVVTSCRGVSRILGHAGPGALFGENNAALPGKELLCDVIAAEDASVLFLDMEKLLTPCPAVCPFHQRVIRNLWQITARKNLELSSRMMHISPRSLRERLLSYLSEQAMENGSPRFTIPFDRQQLADYLGADRSALSAELGKMRRDGLLSFRKNAFELNTDRIGEPLRRGDPGEEEA